MLRGWAQPSLTYTECWARGPTGPGPETRGWAGPGSRGPWGALVRGWGAGALSWGQRGRGGRGLRPSLGAESSPSLGRVWLLTWPIVWLCPLVSGVVRRGLAARQAPLETAPRSPS